MNIWTSPLASLGFQDIQAFIDRKLRENQQIEYKEIWPSQSLSKWLCAFANTDGGIILLGVTAPNEIPDVICGIPDSQADPDNVDQAAWKVTPPIFNCVESIAIPLPGNVGKSVVLIRVQPNFSDVPCNVGGTIYVRTDGSARDVQDPSAKRVGAGSPEEIIRLLRRREAGVEFRKTLLAQSENGLKLLRIDPVLKINIYPEAILTEKHDKTLMEFEEIAARTHLLNCVSYRNTFPFTNQNPPARSPAGIYSYLQDTDGGWIIQLDRFGIFRYLQSGSKCACFERQNNKIHLQSAVLEIWQFCIYAALLYRKLNLFKRIRVECSLIGDAQSEIVGFSGMLQRRSPKLTPTGLDASHTISGAHFVDDPVQAVEPLIRDFLFPTYFDSDQIINLARPGLSVSLCNGTPLYENSGFSNAWPTV